MPYTYEFPHMAVTVDAVVFKGAPARVLLIKRGRAPFEGAWALPGGFVEMDETCAQAAVRELREETGLASVALTFLHYFDAVERDPRERTLALAFWGVAGEDAKTSAADDAADVAWHAVDDLPTLAFDHAEVIERALKTWAASA